MKFTTLAAAALASAFTLSTAAHAAPTLAAEAFDGTASGTPITLATILNANGSYLSFGSDANFSSVTVSGNGIPANTGLALTTLSAEATTAATLTIILTQTGITAPSASLPFAETFTDNALTYPANATFTFSDFVSKTNTAFDLNAADLVTPVLVLVDNGTSESAARPGMATGLTPGALFSETQEITIKFTTGTAGSVSASSQMVPVPEPMSLALLGSGLVGMSAVSRRRKRSNA